MRYESDAERIQTEDAHWSNGQARLPLRIVDAFASAPFEGNPAGVCLLPVAAPSHWMQAVAREVNAAETAFVWPRVDGWDLRWFSVTGEVEMCGHATIAAAHVLWEEGHASGRIDLYTRSGVLLARRADGLVQIDLPSDPPARVKVPAEVAAALGRMPVAYGRARLYALAEFSSEDEVRALRPDLERLPHVVPDGIVCTAPARDSAAHLAVRYFGPGLGNPEDAVTGSAACLLGPWWSARLGTGPLRVRQRSERTGRGGMMTVWLNDGSVTVAGGAVTVVSGWVSGPGAGADRP